MHHSGPSFKRSQRITADLTLLLTSVIWGSAFVAQRVAAQNMNIFLYNMLRFLLGAALIFPLLLWRKSQPRPGFDKKTWSGLLLAGILLFGGTTWQQFGMRDSTAGNAGFITGLYVVIIPVLLGLGLRQVPRRSVWAASILAAAGLFLLSTQGSLRLAPGDGLVLVGAFLWALHVIVIGWLTHRMDIYNLAFGQYLICGLLHLLTGLVFEGTDLLTGVVIWWAVIYTGVFSIAMAFTLQAIGQRIAPAADAAIILSLEAVFAAFFGWLLLSEQLSSIQLLGCGLMLAGMILAQFQTKGGKIPEKIQEEMNFGC